MAVAAGWVITSSRFWLLSAVLFVFASLAVCRLPLDRPELVLCLWRRFLQFPCPGCGLTRAFCLMLAGEWNQAMVLHPLAPFLAVQLAIGWLLWGLLPFSSRLSEKLTRRVPALLLLNGGMLIAVWLVRWMTGTLPQ